MNYAEAYARIEALEAENAKLKQSNAALVGFVEKVAMQTPEKPDYWSSCGQCQHNSNGAEELFEKHGPGSAQQPQ